MALNDIPQWSTVELSLKFLKINPKLFPESYKDHEEFCNLLAHQKWVKYFEKSKNFPVFLHNPFTQYRSRTNVLADQSAVDKRIKQS